MKIANFVWLLLAAASAWPIPAAAQRVPAVAPQLVISTPVEQPVALESVKIHTDIRGSFAVTSIEMRFFNPNRRQLEGELQFPLLEGQRVTGMAMDVDGKLRDAVPVEKTRGQAVFEEVTRAQIDPALLQVTQGNNYKLRVYPILPGKHKTVVIRYLESLHVAGNRHLYRLPLAYAQTLAQFDLTVTVTEKPAPQVRGADALGEFAFERTGRFYTARVSREQFAARGMLEIAIPVSDRPQTYTQVYEGRTYFYAEVPVPARSTPRPLPRAITLIWDASGSGAQRDHAREFALLDAYFKKAGTVDVKLVRLRDSVDAPESFSIRNGDWRSLRRAVERTVYDGATNFAAFVPEAQPSAQEYLLFTDGLGNFGGRDFPVTSVPVYTVASAPHSDSAWLANVAQRSGGRYINLLSHSAAEAALNLLSHTTRLLTLDAEGASQVVATSPFPERGVLRVAGILAASTARVQLGIALPGESSRETTITVGPDAAESPFAALTWASLRVDELDVDYRLNRGAILRLGKAFGLVTRGTSLIVLDRVEDYARFEIMPPPELRAEYERQRLAMQQQQGTARLSQLERVVKLFAQKQAWWAREFPKDERPAVASQPESAMMRAPAPTARPAPKPAAALPRLSAQRAITGDAAAPMSARESSTPAAPQIGIQLRRWTSDAPYIARFAKAAPAEFYRIYLDERASYPNSTAFILDVADQLFEKGQADFGVRVLSNLAEMDLENRHVLRILGYRLLQAGKPQLAIPVFEQVLELSPEEPQSYRDLGLAYAADKQYQKAIDALYEVAIRPWQGRFPEIELIGLAELNSIVVQAEREGVKLDVSRIDPRLLKNLPLDLRVILTWDADDTDIDLWVTDPNGEKSYYGNRLTYQGGRMSPDFTGGYGPEEFSLRAAKPGKYLVQVNFYGHRRQTVAGATTLQVKFITGFGTPQQQERIVTLRLRERTEIVTVGEFEVQTKP